MTTPRSPVQASPLQGELDCEASDTCSCIAQRKDVDARHKAGHDGREAVR